MSITSAKTGATGISLALDNNFMEPIATVLVGSGGSSSIIFNDIPQTYKHLQIRAMSLDNDTAGGGTGNVRCSGFFNGDENISNYKNHFLNGNGASATAGVESDAKWVHSSVRNSWTGPGVSITDILDYANTNKFKTTKALWGWDQNGSGDIRMVSGLWMSTDAVVSIKIVPESGTLKQYSRFSLYGIKG